MCPEKLGVPDYSNIFRHPVFSTNKVAAEKVEEEEEEGRRLVNSSSQQNTI